jgi:hypothetical protein
MSLEWARARALQNEARLRALAKSGERNEWTEVALVSAGLVTVWVEPVGACREIPCKDLPAANQERMLEVANTREWPVPIAGATVRIYGEWHHKSINRENSYE